MMRLIDVLRQNYSDLAARGLRASAWKLDHAAIAQLRREASAEGVDVPSLTSPATFLGVPIEEVPMNGAYQADCVKANCQFAPCHRPERGQSLDWDVFDLDNGTALGGFYATKGEAEQYSIALNLEARRP